ncbi:hypothetical protein [Bradyrhizobium elkanii]|uniref:hypothetical protein n=1 Tax=Bradyrhizobium elkanii TaxID=29448 RepID=UPI0008418A91|nr:hypothetical protein [Bradyrhizobium elkanii]ODM77793.1 hypothetical protein A6452_34525 [Bradyrhizobium elkanii]ODM81751.1 hypothetical protein A6X20_18990 [Bradyrhizobium elkanii]
MLSGSIDALDLDFEVLIREEFSPAARSAAIAAVAREQLAEAQTVNEKALGFVPAHTTLVDGQSGVAEDQVRPDGVIVYTFQLLPEIFGWVAEQLRAHAPVLTGRFRDSFQFYADGVLADPAGEILAASEYVFLSPLPYARKLEEGASRQAPEGVFQAVAALAAQRFGNQALIRFVYRAPIGDALLAGKAGDVSDVRVPAISIQLRG